MRVVIIDLNVVRSRENGVMYCSLQDMDTGERIIMADLEYIMKAIQERGYVLENAEDMLTKIAANFRFYHMEET